MGVILLSGLARFQTYPFDGRVAEGDDSISPNISHLKIRRTIRVRRTQILQEMSLVLGVGGGLAAKAATTAASGKLASWSLSWYLILAYFWAPGTRVQLNWQISRSV